jgi:hypothetical protein
MTDQAFAKGMSLLGILPGYQPSPELLEAYHLVLGELSDAQWRLAVARALRQEKFFPPPSKLLDYANENPNQLAMAAKIYEEIVGHYEAGSMFSPRQVGEVYGIAARDAFIAAGGVRAFGWCEPKDEPFRRRDFVKAWQETARIDPSLMLPPGGDLPRALKE